MTSFQNLVDTSQAYPAATPTSDPQEAAARKRQWQSHLLRAKAAHTRGDTEEALRLYKLGLSDADKFGSSRAEIIQFLRTHLWT